MHLVRYALTTGQIDGTYESALPAMLEAQRAWEPEQYGYLLVEEGLPFGPQEEERYEVQGGALVAKQQLTITADPLTFHADGLDECLVTVEPFTPCTLRVAEVPYALTAEDPMLILTSDVAQTFVIALAPTPGYWGTAVTVEAT